MKGGIPIFAIGVAPVSRVRWIEVDEVAFLRSGETFGIVARPQFRSAQENRASKERSVVGHVACPRSSRNIEKALPVHPVDPVEAVAIQVYEASGSLYGG